MIINFDNASTTLPKPHLFYEQTMELYKKIGFNASRGSYSQAQEMKDVRYGLNANLKKILNSTIDSEVILQSSATHSLNTIIQGLDYSEIKNVYLSPFEHNAVYRPLIELQKRKGFFINIIPFNQFECDFEKLELMFELQKPDLCILTHASNVYGNILPYEQVFSKSRKYNCINVLDCAQTAGLLTLEPKNVDFLVFAGHKTLYGPTGIGGFIYNNKRISIKPLFYGGTGISSEEEFMPNSLPEKYEAGSMNSLGIIGLKFSTDWILETGIESIYNKESELKNEFVNIIQEFNDISFFQFKNQIGIVSCIFKDYSNNDIADILSNSDVLVRTGLHCSPLAHKHIGTFPSGTVRFSFSFFNKVSELSKLSKILKTI